MDETLTKEQQSDQDSLPPRISFDTKLENDSITELLTHPLFLRSQDPLLSTMIEPLRHILQPNQDLFDFTVQKTQFKNRLAQILPQGRSSYDKINKSNKTACWKVIPMTDAYFRCLDCEVGTDSVQCKECFWKANHEGHRLLKIEPQEECACDCGHLDMICLKGTCSSHIPQEQTIEEVLADFPKDVRQKFDEAFKKSIYGILCIFEIQEKARSRRATIGRLGQEYVSALLFFYSYVTDTLSKSFSLILERTLKSTFQAPYSLVWHDCNDLKDEYLAKRMESPGECSCTVLGCLLRFSKHLDKRCQSRLSAMIIESCKEKASSKFLNREIFKYAYFVLPDPSNQKNEIKKHSSGLEGAILNEATIGEDDVLYIDYFLGAFRRLLNHYYGSSQLDKVTLDIISQITCTLAHFFTTGSEASEVALLQTNFMAQFLEILSDFQVMSVYPGEIRLGLFEHGIDVAFFVKAFCGELLLYMVLDHGLKTLGDLSLDKKEPAFKRIGKEWHYYLEKTKSIQDHQRLYAKQINPLSGIEKTLCLMAIHYLHDNITKESLEDFFRNMFPDTYPSNLASNTVRGPLITLGIMRYTEIIRASNLEVCGGYFTVKSVYNMDIVLIQLMSLLIKPQDLFSLFTTSFFSYSQDLIDLCLSYSIIKSLRDHPNIEQMILALEDFLEFFIYMMNDELSLINLNLRKRVSRQRPGFPSERVIKKVFVNILAENRWFEVGDVKRYASLIVCDEIFTPVDSIITKIVLKDPEQYKIKLKKEYEAELDPYIFYKLYHFNKNRQNNLTSEESKTQDRDIVSGQFYTDLPSYLIDIQQNIFQGQLPDFVRHIIINFTKDISRLLQPALKLVLFNLQVVKEVLENPNSNTENLQKKAQTNFLTKDFSQSLNKILTTGHYKECEKCINNIRNLIKQLSSRDLMPQQWLGEGLGEEKKEDSSTEKKRYAKKKMEKLKEEFAKKQAVFAQKNVDLLFYKEDVESADQVIEGSRDKKYLICQYCLDKIDELSSEEYGVPLYIEFTNNFYNTEEEIVFQEDDSTDLSQTKWWPVISSCNHSYHRECFDKHCQNSRGPQNESSQFFSNDVEVQCAFCKKLSNSFLVMNTELASVASESSSERYMLIMQHLLVLRKERLHLMNSSGRQDRPFDPTIQEILKRAYEYFIESFHLHTTPQSLCEDFELYWSFFKTLKNCPTIKDLAPTADNKTFLESIFSNLEQISRTTEKVYPESVVHSLFFNILLEKSYKSRDFSADEHVKIIKDYLIFKLVHLARTKIPDTSIKLPNVLLLFKENKDLLTKALKPEIIFPMQKVLLAYYLNKSILSSSEPSEKYEFCRMLCSDGNASENLDLLLKIAQASLSLDQLIEESLLLIDNLSGSEKDLLSDMVDPETPIPCIGRLKLAPQFHSASLPKTFLQFNQRYISKKCDRCNQYKYKKIKSICLICGKGFCNMSCNATRSPHHGNLNDHASKYHMGLGLFFIENIHVFVSIKLPFNLVYKIGPTYVSELGEWIFSILGIHIIDSSIQYRSIAKNTDFEQFVFNKKVLDKIQKIILHHSFGQEIFENAPLNIETFMINAEL